MSEYEEIKRAVREVLLSKEFLKEFAEAFTKTELPSEMIPLVWNDSEPRTPHTAPHTAPHTGTENE